MQLPVDRRYPETVFRGILVVLLVVSLGLLGGAVVVAGDLTGFYNDVSNAAQLVASLAAAGVAAWTYLRRTPNLLLAHGAFAGATWTLGNAFWYAYFILIGGDLNYPTVADLGFVGAFLFLIAGYLEGMPRSSLPWWHAALIAVPLFVFGLGFVYLLGVNAKTLTTLVILVLAVILLSEAILRSAHRFPVLFGGTIVFSLAHILYALRSTLPDPPWPLNAAGSMAAIAFSLLALAYLGYGKEEEP